MTIVLSSLGPESTGATLSTMAVARFSSARASFYCCSASFQIAGIDGQKFGPRTVASMRAPVPELSIRALMSAARLGQHSLQVTYR